jgi:uncharacterized protein (DUF924 family)
VNEDSNVWGDEAAGAVPANWHERMLAFWFSEHDQSDWFKGGAVFDAEVAQFEPWRQALRHRLPDHFLVNARTALAAVILFDQVPRNVHRGSAEAFATDALAIAIARGIVGAGLDDGLSVDERLFCYLPFEHSEQIDDQLEALRHISSLGRPDLSDYAQRHFDVIKQFGRFPHRNAALGRANRPGEAEAIAAGADW